MRRTAATYRRRAPQEGIAHIKTRRQKLRRPKLNRYRDEQTDKTPCMRPRPRSRPARSASVNERLGHLVQAPCTRCPRIRSPRTSFYRASASINATTIASVGIVMHKEEAHSVVQRTTAIMVSTCHVVELRVLTRDHQGVASTDIWLGP